jgi:hypothetical protein
MAQSDLGGFISLVPLFNFCQLSKIGQKSGFKAKKRSIFYFFSQSQLFCSTQITLSHPIFQKLYLTQYKSSIIIQIESITNKKRLIDKFC